MAPRPVSEGGSPPPLRRVDSAPARLETSQQRVDANAKIGQQRKLSSVMKDKLVAAKNNVKKYVIKPLAYLGAIGVGAVGGALKGFVRFYVVMATDKSMSKIARAALTILLTVPGVPAFMFMYAVDGIIDAMKFVDKNI